MNRREFLQKGALGLSGIVLGAISGCSPNTQKIVWLQGISKSRDETKRQRILFYVEVPSLKRLNASGCYPITGYPITFYEEKSSDGKWRLVKHDPLDTPLLGELERELPKFGEALRKGKYSDIEVREVYDNSRFKGVDYFIDDKVIDRYRK
ncbi:MAG: hypothetical protein AABY07_07730 [Nanoarchaeota archaeon]